MRLAAARGVELIAQARPRPGRVADERLRLFELTDAAALDQALAGRTTILQVVGTTRRRFAAGDTYESSDVGTTRLLIEAARRTAIDHVVLLSSVGAGRPAGAYLRAKAEAEALVTASGLAGTIFRPSFFVGEGHRAPPVIGSLLGVLSARYRPVPVADLAAALLQVACARSPLGVLEGADLQAVLGGGA